MVRWWSKRGRDGRQGRRSHGYEGEGVREGALKE